MTVQTSRHDSQDRYKAFSLMASMDSAFFNLAYEGKNYISNLPRELLDYILLLLRAEYFDKPEWSALFGEAAHPLIPSSLHQCSPDYREKVLGGRTRNDWLAFGSLTLTCKTLRTYIVSHGDHTLFTRLNLTRKRTISWDPRSPRLYNKSSQLGAPESLMDLLFHPLATRRAILANVRYLTIPQNAKSKMGDLDVDRMIKIVAQSPCLVAIYGPHNHRWGRSLLSAMIMAYAGSSEAPLKLEELSIDVDRLSAKRPAKAKEILGPKSSQQGPQPTAQIHVDRLILGPMKKRQVCYGRKLFQPIGGPMETPAHALEHICGVKILEFEVEVDKRYREQLDSDDPDQFFREEDTSEIDLALCSLPAGFWNRSLPELTSIVFNFNHLKHFVGGSIVNHATEALKVADLVLGGQEGLTKFSPSKVQTVSFRHHFDLSHGYVQEATWITSDRLWFDLDDIYVNRHAPGYKLWSQRVKLWKEKCPELSQIIQTFHIKSSGGTESIEIPYLSLRWKGGPRDKLYLGDDTTVEQGADAAAYFMDRIGF